jgi:hypothetical protein
MKGMLRQRFINFDGNFNRVPKTEFFCCVCGKEVKQTSNFSFVWLGEPICDCIIIHPDDVEDEFLGIVGAECRKNLDRNFLVQKTDDLITIYLQQRRRRQSSHLLQEITAMPTTTINAVAKKIYLRCGGLTVAEICARLGVSECDVISGLVRLVAAGLTSCDVCGRWRMRRAAQPGGSQ